MTTGFVALNLSIRKANYSDLDAMYHLDQRLFPPEVRFDMYTFYFHLFDPDSTVFIAETMNAFAGFVIFRPVAARVGAIVTIDVERERQGMGVGTMLMDTVDRFAVYHGFEAIVLQVAVDNRYARGFYEKRGFARKRLLKNYYKTDDAWEMRLCLSEKRVTPPEPLAVRV